MNVNKAIIVGRITNDLELKTTPTGRMVLSFGMATNRTWKNQDGEKMEATDWHNIVAWGKQAETLAEYCVKGQLMYIEGRLETRSWDDEQSGKKMYRTEIVLEQFQFGSRPGDGGGGQGQEPRATKTSAKPGAKKVQQTVGNTGVAYPEEDINPEDIPF
jgi:single-strand DNA-binding protein